jgi:hypothetical protein
MHFKVKKTSVSSANEAQVSIYNLNKDSRGFIDKIGDDMVAKSAEASDDLLIIKAGYLDDQKMLFTGNITKTNSEVRRPEVITQLEALDGLKLISEPKLDMSYNGPNLSAMKVLKDVINRTGCPLANTNWKNISDKTYKNGFAYIGSLSVLLTNVCSYLGLQWSIQNGELSLIPVNASDTIQVVSLSPASGLIESPQRTQIATSSLTNAKDDRQTVSTPSTKKEKKKVLGGLTVKCLLRPEVNPGNIIEVESSSVEKALFRVVEISHEGDTHAAVWTSTILGMAL